MQIINLFAGPGAGKSTTASKVFAGLKDHGVNCELVTEFAKDMAWTNKSALACQPYIWGTQVWRIQRLLTEVDVIVTDCPPLLCAAYTSSPSMKAAIVQEFSIWKDHNVNFFLNRTKPFSTKGRVHTFEESKELDGDIKHSLLRMNSIPFKETTGDDEGAQFIIQEVLS